MAPTVRREKGQKNKQDGCVRRRLQPSPTARLSSFPSPSIITLFTRIASPVCALWGLIRSYVCDGRAAEQESCCCWCVSCSLDGRFLFSCVCVLFTERFQTVSNSRRTTTSFLSHHPSSNSIPKPSRWSCKARSDLCKKNGRCVSLSHWPTSLQCGKQ